MLKNVPIGKAQKIMRNIATLSTMMLAVLLSAGCGNKNADTTVSKPAPGAMPKVNGNAGAPKEAAPAADAPAPPPAPDAAAATPQPAAAPAEGEAPSQDVVQTVLGAVQSYVIANSKNPKDLDELVRTGFLKRIPPTPPGKKLVYDAQKLDVKLVNQ